VADAALNGIAAANSKAVTVTVTGGNETVTLVEGYVDSVRRAALTDAAELTCFSNDYSYEEAFMKMLSVKMSDGDILIAISSSGSSKNIVNAAGFVRKEFPSNSLITFTGFENGNTLRKTGTNNLYVPAGTYGEVECLHAIFLHLIVDSWLAIKGKK